MPERRANTVWQLIYLLRNNALQTIKKYIPQQESQGIAEALLIGYQDDVDKELLQSYSNTGVVHIIAISGLHISMVYALLVKFFIPFKRKKFISTWVQPFFILLAIWLFTLVAGAAASIVRAAVMFSFITIAQLLLKKHSIFNTLAASAFCMLVYNPFVLWDVGFQLSYAAVCSIIIFQKPLYHLLYFRNKIADTLWKLNTVTLSAQLLTLPFILFYFHQFPNYLFIANLIAVPLSGFILYGEITLMALAWFPPLAKITGIAMSYLIHVMNACIHFIEKLPFATTQNIAFDLPQALLLTAFIIALAFLVFCRKIKFASILTLSLFCFCISF